MTGKYPFPDDIRDPNRKEPNPFADDDDAEPQTAELETFAATKHSIEYQPVYQSVLPDRAVMCMIVGILGALASLSGWLTYVSGGVFASLALMPLFGLAGSLPALLISIADLRAMKRGAMQIHRRQWSRLACFLGVLGFLSSLTFFVVAGLYFCDFL